MALQPLVTQAIRDYTIPDADLGTTINLFNHFDDPLTDGLVARFELYNPALGGALRKRCCSTKAGPVLP